LVIQIKDNGSGIDSKYADQVFKIFKRLHSNSEYEGTGVGLAITKE
jgi:light-regulated signal transduction histidine kinase (bacteriophytochrome)